MKISPSPKIKADWSSTHPWLGLQDLLVKLGKPVLKVLNSAAVVHRVVDTANHRSFAHLGNPNVLSRQSRELTMRRGGPSELETLFHDPKVGIWPQVRTTSHVCGGSEHFLRWVMSQNARNNLGDPIFLSNNLKILQKPNSN